MRRSRLWEALDVAACRLLNAHIYVALTIGPVGELLRTIDQLSRNRLRVTLLDPVEDGLDAEPNR